MAPPAPLAAPQQQGPGEFTRMFATPAQQPMAAPKPAASQAPAAARPAKKKTSYVPLFIALGVLLFIAIVVILVFALKK
jgi:hypothetical protein